MVSNAQESALVGDDRNHHLSIPRLARGAAGVDDAHGENSGVVVGAAVAVAAAAGRTRCPPLL